MLTRIPTEPFKGIRRRERISLAREWDYKLVTITSGQSLSDVIDMRMAAGASVIVDPTLVQGYLCVYTAFEPNGAYCPAYDKNGTQLIITATKGAAVTLPAEIFPLGYIKLGQCNSSGVLLAVTANRVFVVMYKP